MREDDPLAALDSVGRDDLAGRRIIGLRGAEVHRGLAEMFGDIVARQSVASYNLVNNAASMVASGSGVAVTLDWLADRVDGRGLCFRPFRPRMVTGTSFVWLKGRRQSSTASALIEELRGIYGVRRSPSHRHPIFNSGF